MKTKIQLTMPDVRKARAMRLHVWRMLLTTLFLLMVYSAYVLVVRPDHPFLRPAAQGEILILSAVIIIDAAADLHTSNTSWYARPLIAVALMLIGFFAITKYLLVHADRNASEEVTRLRWALAFFNSTLTLCSIVISLYLYSLASRNATMDKLITMTQREGKRAAK